MIPVAIFTFGPDGLAAQMAGRSALQAGLGPVFAEVDSANPVTPEMRRNMENSGFLVTDTVFPRPLNLRGLTCFRGLLSSYRRIFAVTGATHILKLDSDTLIQRAGRIKQAVADDVCAASWATESYHFYGCAMVVSKRLVEALEDHIIRWGGLPGFGADDMSEDLAVGHMADRLGLGEVRRWNYDPAGGYLAGWQFDDKKRSIYKERFDVVTFGNRHLLKGRPCEQRDKVAQAMFDHLTLP